MRMLRQTFAILLLAVGVCLGAAQAQQAPDDEDIFARTLDEASPYYYPSLMMRYRAGDTTLTATDYYYLYYGYAFSENYRPLRPIKAEDDMLAVLERINQDSIRYEDMEAVIRCADEVMRSDPFSPRNLNFLVYAYGTIGDTLNERINYDRLTKVLATISASGTGRSPCTSCASNMPPTGWPRGAKRSSNGWWCHVRRNMSPWPTNRAGRRVRATTSISAACSAIRRRCRNRSSAGRSTTFLWKRINRQTLKQP